MARSNFLAHLLKLDRFGYEVEMHYQGGSVYNTLFGALISVVAYSLILVNAVSVFGDYINNEN